MPPGAAAVLINRTHPFRDLVLPLSQTEKRLFDAVDGNRSIGEIAPGSDVARRFFERLWLWDQVVIDSSRLRG